MAIKVLVVLDGAFRFDATGSPPGATDFTYSVLVAALTGAGFDVTKAHLGADSSASPGFASFRFDVLPAGRNLFEFDAIWLIGWNGRNADDPAGGATSTPGSLGPSQLNAIAAYMEAGGGVFATGDHDSIGADLCGYLPRVRIMRAWYGAFDTASPFPQPLPPELQNFTKLHEGRADTVHKKTSSETPASQYPTFPDSTADYVWFDNQSDHFPQTITPIPAGPAHPVLRRDGRDIVVFPDHMHEGNALGEVGTAAYDYASVLSPFGDTTKAEFREVAGHREKPVVIAMGQGLAHASRMASTPNTEISRTATAKSVNTLSAYDGRNAGVGRVVTGSTFHHYVDINLTGSTAVVGSAQTLVGSDAAKNHGYNDDPAVLDDIKAVYVNITNWIARPRPAMGLILERSTFSQAEVSATMVFDSAILVTVDGLKPDQFPGGGVTALGSPTGLAGWAPTLSVAAGVPIVVEPIKVDSDDPALPDRLQRLTFTYRVRFTGDAFAPTEPPIRTVPLTATLAPAALPSPPADTGWLQLVKSANPFMLDLADGNDKTWLSSDIKVFHVVAGDTFRGVLLPPAATRSDARNFIRTVAASINDADFSALDPTEEGSVLSSLSFAMRFPTFPNVYNFALARVRVTAADADPVRVFFRLFKTQTTAALTYRLNSATNMPVDGYQRTSTAPPIALPGTQNGGSDWLSFPMFSADRMTPPSAQVDSDNSQPVRVATGFRIFGALVDNNLADPYLPPSPGSAAAPVSLRTLMMGEHQCIVAEVNFDGAPIPDGATPWTSDKLSQRNLAISVIANPGLEDSRIAFHTFEIEATPFPATVTQPPDELLVQFSANTPAGAVMRLFLSTWNAQEVVDLAARLYARHEIVRIDDRTIELPAGGILYVPLPLSVARQNGLLSVEYPLGIRQGQRFDVSVRQISNKWRRARVPPSKVRRVARAEAERLLAELSRPPAAGVKGAFALSDNKVLVTDLSAFDESGDHALLLEHPEPAAVAAASANSGQWREPIGGFQLGVPVSTREAMLPHDLRILSIMRWRAAQLPHGNRWRTTLLQYVQQLANKVQALGGNPWLVPATPDGRIPPGAGLPAAEGGDDLANAISTIIKCLRRPLGCALILLVLSISLLLLWWILRH